MEHVVQKFCTTDASHQDGSSVRLATAGYVSDGYGFRVHENLRKGATVFVDEGGIRINKP